MTSTIIMDHTSIQTLTTTTTAIKTAAVTALSDCLSNVRKSICQSAFFLCSFLQCKSSWGLATGNSHPGNTYASPAAVTQLSSYYSKASSSVSAADGSYGSY